MTKYATCKLCGASGKNVYVSRKRICHNCSMKNVKANIRQLRTKRGKYWKNYKSAMLKFLNQK